jgi:hypothetical protein
VAEEAYREEDLLLELEDARIQISFENFEKILAELLDNAFKFSQSGSLVRVKTTVNRHLCILSITDHGRGMSSEQIASIGAYMQFKRREYEQQGTGLGLIIASLLARLEGGVLSIDSIAQQGTTVSIVFHCEVQDQNDEVPAQPTAKPKAAHPRRSLILPPVEVLETLYELAAVADTQSICDHLDRLEASDAKYQPFAAKLRRFVNDYRIDLLQQFFFTHLEAKES